MTQSTQLLTIYCLCCLIIGKYWDGTGFRTRIGYWDGNWGNFFEIGRWDTENLHWANTDAHTLTAPVILKEAENVVQANPMDSSETGANGSAPLFIQRVGVVVVSAAAFFL